MTYFTVVFNIKLKPPLIEQAGGYVKKARLIVCYDQEHGFALWLPASARVERNLDYGRIPIICL